MEQKEIKLLSFQARNHRALKVVEVKPDLASKRVVVVRGVEGSGKSSLLECLQTALSGSKAVKNKDSLEPGYLAEVCLRDGDLNIWAGAKVSEGGDFSIYLYSKDEDGKKFIPIMGGKKMTPSEYAKTLTTDLTFDMPSLFSANAPTHRRLIESLFGEELDKLGVEKLKSELKTQEKKRDNARAMCDATGAFMSTFKEEGWSEAKLENLTKPDVEGLKKKLLKLEVDKGSLLRNASTLKELKLSRIKEEGRAITAKIEEITVTLKSGYEAKEKEYNWDKRLAEAEAKYLEEAYEKMKLVPVDPSLIAEVYQKLKAAMPVHSVPEPAVPAYWVSGVEVYDTSYGDLPVQHAAKLKEYKEEADKTEEVDSAEIAKIDAEIAELKSRLSGAETIEKVYTRYQIWLEWIEEKGKYEAKLVELRRRYAEVNTGVEGMKIVPVGDDIWLEYNGQDDPDFFGNKDGEMRQIFNYSQSQCGVIGLLLQAARLDLKPKALRLCILDGIPYTSKGLEIVSKICEEKNLQLITAQTDDRYDTENVPENEIIIEGGECFFTNLK